MSSWSGRRVAAVSLGATALVGALCGLRLNLTASLPRGIYVEIPRSWGRWEPRRGDLVLACAPPAAGELARRRGYLGAGRCPAGTAGTAGTLGKTVLAVSGDVVTLGAEGIKVNGRQVPASQALRRDTRGRPLLPFGTGTYVVAPGELWLFAPYHPRSFDSRYFGPVRRASILGWLVPVLVRNDDRFPGFRLHRFRRSVLAPPAAR